MFVYNYDIGEKVRVVSESAIVGEVTGREFSHKQMGVNIRTTEYYLVKMTNGFVKKVLVSDLHPYSPEPLQYEKEINKLLVNVNLLNTNVPQEIRFANIKELMDPMRKEGKE